MMILKDFQEYNILSNPEECRVVQNPENLPWDAFVSILGMPGNTAYAGWHEYAQSKKGDVVFVSAGAGEVLVSDRFQTNRLIWSSGPVGS